MIEVVEQNFKFLLVEDDEDDVLIIRKMIDKGKWDSNIQMDVARSSNEFFERFEYTSYDLFLLDYRMGVSSGLELLKVLRKNQNEEPVIMLTGQGDEDTVVEALRHGATDYVNKNNLSAESFNLFLQRALRLRQETIQKNQMQASLALQKKLLSGLSEAISILLRTPDQNTGVVHALEIIGNACGADGGVLVEHNSNHVNRSSKWVLSSVWDPAHDGIAEKSIRAVLEKPVERPELKRLLEDFKEGREKEPVIDIEQFGFHQSILVPIRVHDRFWGFLNFGSNDPGKLLGNNLKSTLLTFAASLGWELKRDREGKALQNLVQYTSGETGDPFFQALVVNLASALEVRCAYVSQIVERGQSQAQLIKGWDGAHVISGEKYDLRNSPAEEILCGMYSYYPDRVRTLFPNNEALQSMNIEGFAAVPFYDTSGKILGHLSVMSEHPLTDSERILSILRLFGARAGAELERQKSESKIRNMAYYDSLTKLPNRVLLNDRLDVALRQARRSKTQVAVMYLDFDHFKDINDTYGHMSGDLLLKEGARRLSSCLRKGDTVSRLGGDEFVIVLPDIKDRADIARIALKINSSVKTPFYLEETEIKSSISLGISVFPSDGETPKDLMNNADRALFISKKAGRDSFHFYSANDPGEDNIS